MSDEARHPILVTGAHRSGTTWVGKMLTASGEVAYISEPFNVQHRPGVMRAPVQHWYTYINPDNQQQFYSALLETLNFRYHLGAELKSLRSPKDGIRMLRDAGRFISAKFYHKRPLLKDPFTVFSSPWFYEQLNFEVIVAVRHPAAFVNSLKRLGWSFDFNHLLNQPHLMHDLLAPFHDQMVEMTNSPRDIVGQGSLLWKLVYHVVAEYETRYPRFQVIQHEAISQNPFEAFRLMYNWLGLSFNRKAQAAIERSSSTDNPEERPDGSIYATRISSHENIHHWKNRLTGEEIERIHRITHETSILFYPENSWI